MRRARLCRESATPTWLARALLHAAMICCCVLPVAQRKDLVAEIRRTVFAASGFCSRRGRTALELGSQETRRWRETDSNPRSRGHETRDRALFSGQTAGTIAGARRLIGSTDSEADRQARPLVRNARR
jgi:hypothetical protein